MFIGQTKRTIKTPYKGHMAHLKFRRFNKSDVALHMLEENDKVYVF